MTLREWAAQNGKSYAAAKKLVQRGRLVRVVDGYEIVARGRGTFPLSAVSPVPVSLMSPAVSPVHNVPSPDAPPPDGVNSSLRRLWAAVNELAQRVAALEEENQSLKAGGHPHPQASTTTGPRSRIQYDRQALADLGDWEPR